MQTCIGSTLAVVYGLKDRSVYLVCGRPGSGACMVDAVIGL